MKSRFYCWYRLYKRESAKKIIGKFVCLIHIAVLFTVYCTFLNVNPLAKEKKTVQAEKVAFLLDYCILLDFYSNFSHLFLSFVLNYCLFETRHKK